MLNTDRNFDPDLADLTRAAWDARVQEIGKANGFFSTMGKRHAAVYVHRGDETLLVSFEMVPTIRGRSNTSTPFGWNMVREDGWSHLCMMSDADTWFRDRAVYDVMDALIDDGFFDAFQTVVFYGAGSCGYAAAAFSVAAPGARVLAVQPQATLDPGVTPWDDRFAEMRRANFTDRFGFAPDMLDACDQAFVLYDPLETLDAAHASLFMRPAVDSLRLRYMGDAIESDLIDMGILAPLLRELSDGTLDLVSFAQLYRARRNHPPYLRRLMSTLEARGRNHLAIQMAKSVTGRLQLPRIERRLAQIETTLVNTSEG